MRSWYYRLLCMLSQINPDEVVPGAKHVKYVPAHRDLAVPLVNPNGAFPGFFIVMRLPVISAGAFERAEPDVLYTAVVQESRN